MKASNTEVRKDLLKNLKAFKKQNCHYNYQEQQAVLNLLGCLYPVIKENEKYNEKHPNHGQKTIKKIK